MERSAAFRTRNTKTESRDIPILLSPPTKKKDAHKLFLLVFLLLVPLLRHFGPLSGNGLPAAGVSDN